MSFAVNVSATVHLELTTAPTLEPSALSLPTQGLLSPPRRPPPMLQLQGDALANTTRWQYDWTLHVQRPANATLELRVVAGRVEEARFPCNFTVGVACFSTTTHHIYDNRPSPRWPTRPVGRC